MVLNVKDIIEAAFTQSHNTIITMTIKDPEKPQSIQMEVASTGDSLSPQPEGDYSGAVSKSNAAEIALCRKLDRRILPILWAMYYLYEILMPVASDIKC